MDFNTKDISESGIQNPSSELLVAENQAFSDSSEELLDDRQNEMAPLREQARIVPRPYISCEATWLA
ncbi:hypothetical protein BGX21_010062 [Mortierella sp. AD011]|nr:hypothetical protein BGX21_010062 [Mortierella sp. AD011]